MSKPLYRNYWKEYHEFLDDKKASAFRDQIMQVIGCSYVSFFRKLKSPEHMSIADKTAIAGVYELPPSFLFPELETENA